MSLIKRFPYLSYSKNIIECFLIIGYEEKMLPEIIKGNNISKVQNYSPTIISSIIGDEDYGIIDNDFIISQIFPENPEFILKNENNSSKEEFKNIIYSFMVDSPNSSNGGKKIFYTCFAFIFNEPFLNNNSEKKDIILEEYLIPKAFCIISQYPFFGFFNYICQNLYKLLLKNEENNTNIMPLEIIIYNIVNFTPSPLNCGINYYLFKNILEIPSYNLLQLSGYPYIDFNLLEIFNILPLKLVVEIYFFTIIEQSILFFSSNLEILNIVMFIFFCLNYPFNNSTYFWHIVSINKKDINEENRFASQITTSMLGIYSSYDESINTSAFGDFHFIVDIDNKKLILKTYNDSNEEAKKLITLHSYVHKIIEGKEVESFFLKKYMDELVKSIEKFLKENGFEQKYKTVNFFQNISLKSNQIIQEYCYNFMINLLLVIYQNINLDLSTNYLKLKSSKNFKYKTEDGNILIKNEEKYFFDFFKSSSKYKIYFENFIINCISDELFKIPFVFSEEFINLKFKCIQNKILLKLPYFLIIDHFYMSLKETKIIQIFHFYFKFIDDELKIEFIKEEEKNEIKNEQPKKLLFHLNRNLLQKYVYILKNHLSKKILKEYFPSIILKEKPIASFDLRHLVDTIIIFFEKNNYIDNSNYLIYSSIYIFSILIPLYTKVNLLIYIDKLLTFSKKVNFFIRYHINIIIQSFYQYYLINKEKKKFPDLTDDNISFYIYLSFLSLKEQQILPNEEMILKQKELEYKNKNKQFNFDVKTKGIEYELNDNKESKLEISGKDTNFQIYMKYNFDSTHFFSNNTVINMAMKEQKECNIAINKIKISENENKDKDIKIILKIKEKIFKEDLFSPIKIFKVIKNEFENYSKTFSLKNVDTKIIKGILINLIQYSVALKELDFPYEIFTNGLCLFDKYIENNEEN